MLLASCSEKFEARLGLYFVGKGKGKGIERKAWDWDWCCSCIVLLWYLAVVLGLAWFDVVCWAFAVLTLMLILTELVMLVLLLRKEGREVKLRKGVVRVWMDMDIDGVEVKMEEVVKRS